MTFQTIWMYIPRFGNLDLDILIAFSFHLLWLGVVTLKILGLLSIPGTACWTVPNDEEENSRRCGLSTILHASLQRNAFDQCVTRFSQQTSLPRRKKDRCQFHGEWMISTILGFAMWGFHTAFCHAFWNCASFFNHIVSYTRVHLLGSLIFAGKIQLCQRCTVFLLPHTYTFLISSSCVKAAELTESSNQVCKPIAPQNQISHHLVPLLCLGFRSLKPHCCIKQDISAFLPECISVSNLTLWTHHAFIHMDTCATTPLPCWARAHCRVKSMFLIIYPWWVGMPKDYPIGEASNPGPE